MVNKIEFELLLLYVFTFGVSLVLCILIGQISMTTASVLTDWLCKKLYHSLLFLNWQLIVIIGFNTEPLKTKLALIIVIILTQMLLIIKLLTLVWPENYKLLCVVIVILHRVIDCLTDGEDWLCSSLTTLILPLLMVFLSVSPLDSSNDDLKAEPLRAVVIVQLLIIIKLIINILREILY